MIMKIVISIDRKLLCIYLIGQLIINTAFWSHYTHPIISIIQYNNTMLAHYLKKKENVEVIEIWSDDEQPQTPCIPNNAHLPVCKEEENTFTIFKNARPTSTPQNTTTKSA